MHSIRWNIADPANPGKRIVLSQPAKGEREAFAEFMARASRKFAALTNRF